MENLIHADVCRCYGAGCADKAACLRFRQIAVDAKRAGLGAPVLYGYAATLREAGEDCPAYMGEKPG